MRNFDKNYMFDRYLENMYSILDEFYTQLYCISDFIRMKLNFMDWRGNEIGNLIDQKVIVEKSGQAYGNYDIIKIEKFRKNISTDAYTVSVEIFADFGEDKILKISEHRIKEPISIDKLLEYKDDIGTGISIAVDYDHKVPYGKLNMDIYDINGDELENAIFI